VPKDPTHASESASVQITPAPPAPDPVADPPEGPETPSPETQEPKEKEKPVSNAIADIKPLHKLGAILSALALVLLVACSPNTNPGTPSHSDTSVAQDAASIQQDERPAWIPAHVPWVHLGNPLDEQSRYQVHVIVAKCFASTTLCTPNDADEIVTADNNLLMTAGATQLWNCLSGVSCSTALSTTNTQLAVGDGSTAPAAGNTDLAAAAGTKINAADASSCTNATPIVCSGTFSPAAASGQVYQFSGFSGAGAAAINNTFEATATSNASTITLLNSAGSGAITVTGGLIKPINYYRQQANASGSAVVATNQITYVATFGTSNANFAWNEWGVTTGAAATNKQAQVPPLLLNRATPGGGLGTKTSAASWTLTVVLSLS
jgi:hypothetical protein